ncbi:hypothetical protein [Streptomyces sp. LaPpAH-108]|uniref:hypothetical protein n=1 Tax=Streptomyces sp. LaPpAH-108 TaxID=1155714 RepID=UPI00036AB3B8|nr:hypothetical protein [Streptomyces sp. LaPpAH-108]
MHRPTTTAALWVTVAVSALTACVTVRGPAPLAPRPAAGTATPRPVQAPAREALARMGPSPDDPKHPASSPRPSTPPPAPPAAHPTPTGQAPGHAAPPAPAPRSRPTIKAPDICALGRKYGGWQKDSPASVICGRAYGR